MNQRKLSGVERSNFVAKIDRLRSSDSERSASTELEGVVELAYKFLLGRPPENDAVIASHVQAGSAAKIFESVAASQEAEARLNFNPSSVFHHFASIFDAKDTIRRHAQDNLVSDPQYLTNFLGVRIEEAYMPELLYGKSGTIEPIPIPANWHADVAEWAAALRAVDLARGTFVVAELGCGWGCWLNNTGVAARNLGLKPRLIGVEGDEGHITFARRCCTVNGFLDDEVTLYRGIAAAHGGIALFPKQDTAGIDWGLQPIFGATEQERSNAASEGRYDELPLIPLEKIVGESEILDLLHIDIQGGEADLIEQSLDFLQRQVAYVLIGTHSRVIEGRLMSALWGQTWRLEIERTAIVTLIPERPVTIVDGVQGWRNMLLRPE